MSVSIVLLRRRSEERSFLKIPETDAYLLSTSQRHDDYSGIPALGGFPCAEVRSGPSRPSRIVPVEIPMQMKQGEKYTCGKCGCDVSVTVAPTVAGKGGQGSLTCCGEKMSPKS